MSVHLTFLMIINLTPIFVSFLILSQIFHHILRQKLSNAHYIFCLWQLFFLLMLTHIFFVFVQVITRFISCANSFANSHSERGSSAIFGFEAFFQRPYRCDLWLHCLLFAMSVVHLAWNVFWLNQGGVLILPVQIFYLEMLRSIIILISDSDSDSDQLDHYLRICEKWNTKAKFGGDARKIFNSPNSHTALFLTSNFP